MKKLLDNLLDKFATHFKNDASKMLIWTGVAGWTLSSAAQIGAIIFNKKIPDEQKSFLVPQEIYDACINIGMFFLVTQATKRLVAKMFTTGKFAPKTVRDFLDRHKNLYSNKVGKYDFNLEEIKDKHTDFPTKNYWVCKDFGTTVATVSAGIVSSNLITPVIRNNWASKAQQRYIDYKNNNTVYPSSGGNLRV